MCGWRQWTAVFAGLTILAVGGGFFFRPASAQNTPLKMAPDGRRLELTFADDFDSFRRLRPGQTPSGGVWLNTFGDGSKSDLASRTIKSNGELQIYVDPDMTDGQGRPLGLDPFKVHDGTLDLIANPASPDVERAIGGYHYVSGMISSQPTFSQLYGYFEARVKLPRGKGLWPAVWLLPADLSWPPEIDIMESIGDPMTAYMTVHSARAKTVGVPVHPASDGFHDYAVEWDPSQIIFYLDGAETQRSPTPADMHKPMFVLANLALGGGWAGPPDPSTPFPAVFSIDYIRIYRLAP
jgi:beta-glucanase (GH16 family)